MKKFFRRVSAVVVALAVALTMVVFDVPETATSAADEPAVDVTHTDHTGWTTIDRVNDLGNLKNGGKFRLSSSISLGSSNSTISITKDATICLNGLSINGKSLYNKYIFEIDNGATLNICDCKSSSSKMMVGYGIVHVINGTFNMYSGAIKDCLSSNSVYPVCVEENGTFNMYGGTIMSNKASLGAVTVKGGTLNLDGDIRISNTYSEGTTTKERNVYFDGAGGKLKIGENFAAQSAIGINTSPTPECKTSPVVIAENVGKDVSNDFKWDNKKSGSYNPYFVYSSTDQTLMLKVTHKWVDTSVYGESAWEITKDPTVSETGILRHNCQVNGCSGEDTILPLVDLYSGKVVDEVSGLTIETTIPTRSGIGLIKYTKAGKQLPSITIPPLETSGQWTKKTTPPTLDAPGTNVYTNAKFGTVTKSIPKLTDDTVWTRDDTQHVDPTEEDEGKDVYKSTDYGDVTVNIPKLEHTHEWGNWTITKDPTFTETGTAQRVCTKDSTHVDTKTLPVLTDTSVWTKDADQHIEPTKETEGKDVYKSEYGDVTVSYTHTLTHVPEVPPTEDAPGTKEHWHCDDCGKDFLDENGNIEATADDLRIGKIETEVQAPENVPKSEIATPKEEFISAALTEEEQEKVKEGTDIKIILKIEDASESAPAEDKEKIDTAIGGLDDYKLGQYLDVTLLKKIGEQEHEVITGTSKPIAVTFEIPKNFRGKAKYSVIRIHNGETTVLEDEDDNPDTITVKTDKFSTYALTYQDKPAPSDTNGGNTSGNQNPPSGDNSFDSNNSDTASSGDDNSSDENTHTPNVENSVSSEGDTGKPNGNPSTGVAISFVPLAAVAALITAAAKRKKK